MSRHEIVTSSGGETTGSLAYEIYSSQQAALIDLIWVHPRCRGKKIGTTLMSMCLEQLGLANIQVVYLLVSKANIKAMNLYRRLGFHDLPEVSCGPYAVMGHFIGTHPVAVISCEKKDGRLRKEPSEVRTDGQDGYRAMMTHRWNNLVDVA